VAGALGGSRAPGARGPWLWAVGLASVPFFALLLFALAAPLPVPADAAAAVLSGASVEVFGVCWATALQQEIPPERLPRVSAYDALGNYLLTPAGTALAGPLAAAFGSQFVLAAGGVLVIVLPLLVLLVPEVRHLRRTPSGLAGPAQSPAGAGHR
jgi:hypothetical protein